MGAVTDSAPLQPLGQALTGVIQSQLFPDSCPVLADRVKGDAQDFCDLLRGYAGLDQLANLDLTGSKQMRNLRESPTEGRK